MQHATRRRTRRCTIPSALRWTATGLLFLAAAGAVAAADPPPPWRAKVDGWVLQRADAGAPVEALLLLDAQAERADAAASPEPLAARLAWIRRLRDAARRAQAPLLATLQARGIEHRSFWIANAVWIRVDAGRTDVLAELAARTDVRRIEGNRAFPGGRPVAVEPAPRAPSAVGWNISQIDADDVWALGYDGSGVVVGGQDTGYEWDHPALRNAYRGWDGVAADHDYNWHDAIHDPGSDCGFDSPFPCDDNNHGTHTMGTMVGDDGGTNQIGVAPGARWIACRNMNEGDGTPATYTECFQWFVAPTDLDDQNPDPSRAPDVINNSWACPLSEGCAPLTLQAVVENTRAAGIVVVGSAGNEGSGCSTVSNPPAIYDATFSVGATDSSDAIAGFSSRGPVTVDGSGRLKPDVSAPGVSVRSSVRGGGYANFQGTSMAGPHVVGLVALLLDARPDLRGHVDEIEEIVRRSAVPLTSTQDCGGVPGSAVPNAVFGHGRVSALEAVTGDVDGDGSGNLEDCRPIDAAAWALPQDPDDLRLTRAPGGGARLAWSAPAGGAGGAAPVTFDVLRAATARFDAPACLTSDAPATELVDAAPGGDVRFYLVRARNACGASAGGGDARVLPPCPQEGP